MVPRRATFSAQEVLRKSKAKEVVAASPDFRLRTEKIGLTIDWIVLPISEVELHYKGRPRVEQVVSSDPKEQGLYSGKRYGQVHNNLGLLEWSYIEDIINPENKSKVFIFEEWSKLAVYPKKAIKDDYLVAKILKNQVEAEGLIRGRQSEDDSRINPSSSSTRHKRRIFRAKGVSLLTSEKEISIIGAVPKWRGLRTWMDCMKVDQYDITANCLRG
ncbi:hypothetical protein RhiirA4_462131 [Rhizophagus irregularis]|uniref:Uncharacterized protein n=1 Tax=Rhizophagus irregularis TaxID=588596 RepID=A0A2I1GKB6_9GLOM|nr:hypothetical protein RhiirA4_462131 [Rhizophagus irregularis]